MNGLYQIKVSEGARVSSVHSCLLRLQKKRRAFKFSSRVWLHKYDGEPVEFHQTIAGKLTKLEANVVIREMAYRGASVYSVGDDG